MVNFCMIKAIIAVCCVCGALGAPGGNFNPNANPNASNGCRGSVREGEACVTDSGVAGVCVINPASPNAYGLMICKPDCGPAPIVAHAHLAPEYDPSVTLEGTVAPYECEPTFVASDGTMELHVTCGSDGEWSEVTFECQPEVVDCGSAPNVHNAHFTSDYNESMTGEGDKATYACDENSDATSVDLEVTCRSNGQWQEVPFSCVGCGLPPALDNGQVDLTYIKTNYFPDEGASIPSVIAEYTCDNGITPNSARIYCHRREPYTWDPFTFSCQ